MEDLKRILERVLDATPNYEENMERLRVFEAWPRAVGEKIASRAWPVKLTDDGVLLIAAENSAWLQSLRYLEPQILEKLEAELKHRVVKQLRLMIAGAPIQDKSSTSTPKGILGKK
jgi:predicted nucleic acid-binding Zn ribbon protein